MRPPGSIVVMLFRPRARIDGAPGNERWIAPGPGAPWMLDDGGGTIEPIIPTPQLEAMLPGGQAVFCARRTAGTGWDIIGAARIRLARACWRRANFIDDGFTGRNYHGARPKDSGDRR